MFGNWNFNFAIVLYNTRGGHVRGTHITCYHALSIVSKRLVYIGDPRKNITLCLLPDGGQMLSREQGEGGGILVHPISRFWQFPSSEKLCAKFTEINRLFGMRIYIASADVCVNISRLTSEIATKYSPDLWIVWDRWMKIFK